MTALQLAKILAKGNGKTAEELEPILEQRNRDIERGGYEKAFKRVTYEGSEYLKNINKLRGEW